MLNALSINKGSFSVLIFFSELCWGKTMVAYTKPQQWKKEESERLRGERDQIKFNDLGFDRLQVVEVVRYNGENSAQEMNTGVHV